MKESPQASTASRLRRQSYWCGRLGSPLYASLLGRAAEDAEAGGPCWDVLSGDGSGAQGAALALRFMGAVHRLVLTGAAPALAPHYPSVGGEPEAERCWRAFRSTVGLHREALRELIELPVQTNEVGRCAALVGGFMLVARETRMPLRLLETGASAGLNLRWDSYYYEARGETWGDPSSRVRLTGAFVEGRPPFEAGVRVASRRGCDAKPVDPLTPEGELTLLSFVWADQTERLALLRGAIATARGAPVTVDEAAAAEWLGRRLGEESRGAATVVFHSIMWQYLSEGEQRRFVGLLERAGASATVAAPLAWLRMEPGADMAEVRLTVWPGGSERLLATAGFHGRDVRWLADL